MKPLLRGEGRENQPQPSAEHAGFPDQVRVGTRAHDIASLDRQLVGFGCGLGNRTARNQPGRQVPLAERRGPRSAHDLKSVSLGRPGPRFGMRAADFMPGFAGPTAQCPGFAAAMASSVPAGRSTTADPACPFRPARPSDILYFYLPCTDE